MSMLETDSAEAASLLRQRPFVLFWIARLLSSLGLQAQAVTIAWQVYSIARNTHHDVRQAAFAVGMIGLAQFLPVLAMTLPAGEMADRYDRRLIAAICLAVDAATAAGLAILAFADGRAIWPIYVAAILFGSARTFLSPANTALGPMLVPRALLPKAIAWTSLSWQGASILGPALGGILCAISPVVSFGVAFGFYLASAGILAGTVLAWVRAFGVFGPIIIVAGGVRGKTEVLPTSIYLEISIGRLEAALAISLLMVVAATAVLLALRGLAGKSVLGVGGAK